VEFVERRRGDLAIHQHDGYTTNTANFTTQFYLTMNAGTGGSVSPGSGWNNSGASVNISATPKPRLQLRRLDGSGTARIRETEFGFDHDERADHAGCEFQPARKCRRWPSRNSPAMCF